MNGALEETRGRNSSAILAANWTTTQECSNPHLGHFRLADEHYSQDSVSLWDRTIHPFRRHELGNMLKVKVRSIVTVTTFKLFIRQEVRLCQAHAVKKLKPAFRLSSGPDRIGFGSGPKRGNTIHMYDTIRHVTYRNKISVSSSG
ncbi:hypothetical protein C8R45DRAFT_947845 [Mycena sanguinolenta]|nr:hypothetical protein C8R45DRAFT_947845 [Mycena sanguinolenta]